MNSYHSKTKEEHVLEWSKKRDTNAIRNYSITATDLVDCWPPPDVWLTTLPPPPTIVCCALPPPPICWL